MKKYISIFLLLFLTMILSWCFTSQDEVNKAKQNLWIISWDNNLNDEKINKAKQNLENTSEKTIKEVDLNDTKQLNEIQKTEKKEEFKKIEIKSLTDNQLLKLDDLSGVDLLGWAVEITWKTLWNVDKIVVKFSNETSDFPDDTYTLKKFKAWDKTFLYRAFSKYETLDYWRNVYIFEAYSGDEITKLELILNVKDDVSNETVNNWESIDITKLPVSEKFWNPIELWNWKIWYSDLNWLEIKSEVLPDLTCEKVTSMLADKINWYFYWNTCRYIKDKEWVSFFVIRLDWDKYIYEKNYYLPYQWLYWVQELETWTWVTSINIWEKNSELKEKNKDFWILEVTDDLFKQILK